MSGEHSDLDHPFWRYSLSVYSKDSVPAELIALQDTFDIDVNVALFCLWLGRAVGLRLSDEDLGAISARCIVWNAQTVIPMRGVRRYLKSGTAVQPIAQCAAELRTQIKRLELLAEQIEQAILYDWFADQRFSGAKGARDIAEHNLTVFMRRSVPDWDLKRTGTSFVTTLDASDEVENEN